MPKPRGEETKKHGDPLEPLIDSAQGGSPQERELDETHDDDDEGVENDDVEEDGRGD